jgi:alcohol dehydrogenase YqhD (iron-dependent ADH family)
MERWFAYPLMAAYYLMKHANTTAIVVPAIVKPGGTVFHAFKPPFAEVSWQREMHVRSSYI